MRADIERTPPDHLELVDQIRSRSEAIKHQEVERALTKLEALGSLTDEQAQLIEEMADGIVTALLAPPERTIRWAVERDDVEALDAARRIFASESRRDD